MPNHFLRFLEARAARHPERTALALPSYRPLRGPETAERLTFGDLLGRVGAVAHGLRQRGVGTGDRVLVLVPLSGDLYAAVLGVMAAGAVAVLAPAGGGLRPFREAVRVAAPRAVVAEGGAARLRWLVPALWRRAAVRADRLAPAPLALADVPPHADALLTFTSGSTGRPKGAARTHGTLSAQHLALAASHPLPEGAVALTPFPVVALHHLSCGTPTVLPAVDLRDVASVRPEWVARQIEAEGVTALTGPPPFVRALAEYARGRGAPFSGITHLGIGGAPVRRELLEAAAAAFPHADAAVIYGSTEAEPVAAVHASELLPLPAGGALGYPAGHPDPAAEVRLIAPHDAPIRLAPGQTLDALGVGEGAWGEVIVAGSHVVERYVGAPAEEARHKLRDEGGRVWHRMGDVARRDASGRLWLGGRVGRMLPSPAGPVAPFPLETALDRLPGVRRAALHGWRAGVLLWIEGEPAEPALHAARALLAEAGLAGVDVRAGVRIPVDARHRWKVDYAALDRLAEGAR